jgi:hypothetical protein
MKNTLKLLGIIVFVAVISFLMVTCDADADDFTLTISGIPKVGKNLRPRQVKTM